MSSDLDWLEPAARTRYVRVPEWIVDRADLSGVAKALYLVLARHVNRDEGHARPGQERLCALLDIGSDRLTAATRELRGWRPGEPPRNPEAWTGPQILHVKRRGQGLTNLYRLRFSEPDEPGIQKPAEPESRNRQDRPADPGSAGMQNTLDPGTNQLEVNQTEVNQGATPPAREIPVAGIEAESRPSAAYTSVEVDPLDPVAALPAVAATGNRRFAGAWQMGDGERVVALIDAEPDAVQLEVVKRLRDEAPRWKSQGVRHVVETRFIPDAREVVASRGGTTTLQTVQQSDWERRQAELQQIAADRSAWEPAR